MCKGIICIFNDPKESFSDYLIFIGGKKTWHPTFRCVDGFEQICEARDEIVLLGECMRNNIYTEHVLVSLQFSLFWVACLCGSGLLDFACVRIGMC